MVTNLCRSAHICIWGGEATITATTPQIRLMALSRIVIRVDIAISNHLGYPSTQGGGSGRLDTHRGSIHPCTPAFGRHGYGNRPLSS